MHISVSKLIHMIRMEIGTQNLNIHAVILYCCDTGIVLQ